MYFIEKLGEYKEYLSIWFPDVYYTLIEMGTPEILTAFEQAVGDLKLLFSCDADP